MSEMTVQPKIVKVNPTDDGVSVAAVRKNVVVNPQKGTVIYNVLGGGATTVVAAENLGGHRIVTVEGYYASKDNLSDKFKILGMTTGAVVSGDDASIITHGFITESSWNWTVGNPIFLDANGLLTQTPPIGGFRMIIGIPQTSTSMFVDISEPIIII